MSAARRRLLDEVAAQVPAGTGSDCVRVAVDGVDGSGKTVFADQLAGRLRAGGREAIRVSADDFHHARAVRYRRGRGSPEGFWLDSYDYAGLRRSVLDPLGPGGSRCYRYAGHDLASDLPLSPARRRAAPGAVLVLDGLFLHRDELVDVWELSIFLQVPFRTSAARMAARDGSAPDPEHPDLARYVQGQRLYFAACTPWLRANLVIDNRDPNAPVLTSTR